MKSYELRPEQQKLIPSKFWTPEFQDQDVGKAGYPRAVGEGQVPLWFASSLWGPNLCLHLHMTFSLCVSVSVPPFTVDTVYIALGLYPTAVRSHPTYHVSNSPFFQTRPHCAVVGCQDHTGIWTEHISTSNSIFHISVTKNFTVALAGLLMNNGGVSEPMSMIYYPIYRSAGIGSVPV